MQRTEKETLWSRLLLCHKKALAREHLLQGDWKSGHAPPTRPSLCLSALLSSVPPPHHAFIWKLHQNHLFFQYCQAPWTAALSSRARAGPQPLFPHLWAFTVARSSILCSLGGGWIVNIFFFFESIVSYFRNTSPDSLVTQGRGMHSWNY